MTDPEEAEDRCRLEPVDRLDAEKFYERRWAMTLVEKALARLRDESGTAGKAALFERLHRFAAGESGEVCKSHGGHPDTSRVQYKTRRL